MSVLGWYVLVGLPAILLSLAYGALVLVRNDARRIDERSKPTVPR